MNGCDGGRGSKVGELTQESALKVKSADLIRRCVWDGKARCVPRELSQKEGKGNEKVIRQPAAPANGVDPSSP